MPGGKLPNLTVAAGCAMALVVAVATIYMDCYQRLSKTYRNVPPQLFTSGPVFALAGLCGLIAALAYFFTDPTGTGYVDKLLTLSIENHYVRGLYVGALVLVLIRSKFFQFQGSDVGGEFFYNLGSQKALNSVVLRWADWRDSFVDRIVPRTFAQPDFDRRMITFMREIAAVTTDAAYRSDIESQIEQIERERPNTDPAANDPSWQLYRRTVTRMTLEICGTRPLKAFAHN